MPSSRVQLAIEDMAGNIVPYLEELERRGGIPAGFWEDPYILGVIYGNGFVPLNSIDDLSHEQRQQASDAIGRKLVLFGFDPTSTKGTEIVRAGSPEFLRGVAAAMKIIGDSNNISYDDDPEVRAAKAMIERLGNRLVPFGQASHLPQARLVAVLQQQLWYDEVEKRVCIAKRSVVT